MKSPFPRFFQFVSIHLFLSGIRNVHVKSSRIEIVVWFKSNSILTKVLKLSGLKKLLQISDNNPSKLTCTGHPWMNFINGCQATPTQINALTGFRENYTQYSWLNDVGISDSETVLSFTKLVTRFIFCQSSLESEHFWWHDRGLTNAVLFETEIEPDIYWFSNSLHMFTVKEHIRLEIPSK